VGVGAGAAGLAAAGDRTGAGVTEGAVSQWCERARRHGATALRRIPPGATRWRIDLLATPVPSVGWVEPQANPLSVPPTRRVVRPS
jgi:hypothetical protein